MQSSHPRRQTSLDPPNEIIYIHSIFFHPLIYITGDLFIPGGKESRMCNVHKSFETTTTLKRNAVSQTEINIDILIANM